MMCQPLFHKSFYVLNSAEPKIGIISFQFSARALSGVFLAEQIRQQQLTAALESRLDPSSFSAIQTALLMNKLKAGAAVTAASTTTSAATVEKSKRGSRGGRGGGGKKAAAAAVKDKKNTVASLLAKSRLIPDMGGEPPELTIEPVGQRRGRVGSNSADDRFDTSDNGRRFVCPTLLARNAALEYFNFDYSYNLNRLLPTT